KTAVSTVISEARDFSCTIFDEVGNLVAGAATVLFHFGVVAYSAKTILREYGDDIAPGDLFIANDPHHGGGLHPQDVILLKPIFDDGRRIAWSGASGHMLDVGGMVPGSFAPSARECFQEALRIPPTKLFRKGELDRGVWNLILNNIRMADKVSMDLMSLVAGANVAEEKVLELAGTYGRDLFIHALEATQDLSEEELRRRIAELPDGEYSARSWTEFGDEFFPVVCTLSIDGTGLADLPGLRFDYTGSAPQCPYFFNSKAQIVESELVIRVYQLLTPDVPFTQGVLRPIRIEAPKGSIVDSVPPAPISAAHMHVGLLAMELGETCLKKALAASRSARRPRITSQGGTTGLGNSSWTARRAGGAAETFLLMDGNAVGGGACIDRDGINLTGSNYGGPGLVYPDVEIVEQTSPVLVLYKRLRVDAGGAGRFRGGASVDEALTPYGAERLDGTLFGMRRYLPVNGLFGGYPGACTLFERSRTRDAVERLRDGEDLSSADAFAGALEALPNNTGGVVVEAGEAFVFGCAAGGGLGDPLERDPSRVARDVRSRYVSAAAAERVYGVV
ncbi:MAG: hydantoinase B/oxoprolinase family protein, partial [Candidatus Binatia bacterium]